MNKKNFGFQKEKIERMLEQCLSAHELQLSSEARYNIIFHMTDWLQDLAELCELYLNSNKYSPQIAKKILTTFLLHAPEHISAAAELLTGIGVEHIFRDVPPVCPPRD